MVVGDIGLLDENRMPELLFVLDEGLEEYLEHVGEATLEQIDMGFAAGEDALGQPWEPLKDPEGGEILIDTGELRASFEYEVDKTELEVRIGSNAEHARYHEHGVPSQNLPRRPMLKPAAIWAERKLVVPEMETVIGERIDRVSF